MAAWSGGGMGGGFGGGYSNTPWSGGSIGYAQALASGGYNPSLSSIPSYSSGISPGAAASLGGDPYANSAPAWLNLATTNNPYSGFGSSSLAGGDPWAGMGSSPNPGQSYDPWSTPGGGSASSSGGLSYDPMADVMPDSSYSNPQAGFAAGGGNIPMQDPFGNYANKADQGRVSTGGVTFDPSQRGFDTTYNDPIAPGFNPNAPYDPAAADMDRRVQDAGRRANEEFTRQHGYPDPSSPWVSQRTQQLMLDYAPLNPSDFMGAGAEALNQAQGTPQGGTDFVNRWQGVYGSTAGASPPPDRSVLDQAQLNPGDFGGGPSTGRNPPMLDYDPILNSHLNWGGNTPTGYYSKGGGWVDYSSLNPADFGVDDFGGRFDFGTAAQAGRANIPTDAWSQQALRGSDLGQGLARQGPDLPPDYVPPDTFDERFAPAEGSLSPYQPPTFDQTWRERIAGAMTGGGGGGGVPGGGWFEEPQAAPLDNYLRQQQEMQAARDWYAQTSG